MTSPLPSGLAQRSQPEALALLRPARPRPSVLTTRFRPSAGSRPRLISRSVLAVIALSLSAAACSSSPAPSSTKASSGGTPPATGSAPASPAAVTIDAKSVPKLGNILVTSGGLTLYMFVPDKDAKVTCVSLCAATWPPVFIKAGAKPTAGAGGVQQTMLGVDPDPAGGSVVTYNGWPLYGYTGDQAPGQATGQAVDVNGGFWYVVNTAGQVVKATP
jgi:predicted lipoprotein with Yx(FWY)xxD motif